MLDVIEENNIAPGDMFDGHYRLIRPLSTDGGTADVWLAEDVNTIDNPLEGEAGPQEERQGMLVAIKIYRPKNALDIEGEQRFRDEFKIVYECRHANLLQPTGFSIFKGRPYLVLPYCRNGSSEQFIGKKMSPDEMWKYILDVSSGLNRLHSNSPQIIHQDIKPANILIDNTHNYAITDFGISSTRGGKHGYYYEEENSGTLAYMAPERFQDGVEPMPQSDIWAFGATLCEILTGSVPFGEEGGAAQVSGKGAFPEIPGVPSSIKRLIYACLDKEPGNRPTAQQLVEAARLRQFPVKAKRPVQGVSLASVLVLAAAILAWVFIPKPEEPISTEEAYGQAITLMESDDPGTFMRGYRQMDSLSNLKYIPAMYEIAFTQGWFTDTESLRRKEILGIKYDSDKLPDDPRYNTTAVALFQEILEAGDSSYAAINAKAAYRLSGYMVNNKVFNKDGRSAVKWSMTAYEWAKVANDQDIMDRAMKWVRGAEDFYKSDEGDDSELQMQIEKWLSEHGQNK